MIQINFAGNLVRDPEVRQGKNSPYTTFSVAATHGAKDGSDPNKPGTEFIECIAGGKTGENIGKGRRKNGEASGAPAGGSAGPELSEDDIPF